MKRRLMVAVLLVVACANPGWAQNDEPSFTLSSNQTYGSGDKPEVSVWAHNVKSLEFRLYRVHDPVKFFALLKDQHSFGGNGPRPGHERTLLEKFHAWKHRLWAWIRDFFREQFTDGSRSKIREWREEREVAHVSRVANYAQMPFLSRDQLVSVWGGSRGSHKR
jgi:hypothetical protein